LNFPQREIDRYAKHGTARADLSAATPIIVGCCLIPLDSLESLPKCYWVTRQHKEGPLIVLASSRIPNASIPKSAQRLSGDFNALSA